MSTSRSFYDAVTGDALLGEEDETSLRWRLYDLEKGVRSGIILGESGSGRSNVINILLVAAAKSGLLVPWLADPLGRNRDRYSPLLHPVKGSTKPVLSRAAFDLDRTGRLLKSTASLVIDRHRRGVGHQVTPENPGILLCIDECEYAFRTGTLARAAETILTQGQQVGVALVATCADEDVNTTFGGRWKLREAFARTPNHMGMGSTGMQLLARLGDDITDPGNR